MIIMLYTFNIYWYKCIFLQVSNLIKLKDFLHGNDFRNTTFNDLRGHTWWIIFLFVYVFRLLLIEVKGCVTKNYKFMSLIDKYITVSKTSCLPRTFRLSKVETTNTYICLMIHISNNIFWKLTIRKVYQLVLIMYVCTSVCTYVHLNV